MPPKKRNRDVDVKPEPDPDQLDKDELKGMLRDSIDREANLTVQLENQKVELEAKIEKQKKEFEGKLDLQKELVAQREWQKKKIEGKNTELGAKIEEQKKEIDKLSMHRIILQYCHQDEENGNVQWVFYPNLPVVQQRATIATVSLDFALQCPGFKPLWCSVFYFAVKTCNELVNIFENGLKAGAVLEEEHHPTALFSLIVVTERENNKTIPAGQENQYHVVAARSHVNRYNSLLDAYLQRIFLVPELDRMIPHRVLYHPEKYDQDIQNRIQALGENDYNTVLKSVWVTDAPDTNGRERAHKADFDFNRMLEIAVGCGTETEIGFWDDAAEEAEE